MKRVMALLTVSGMTALVLIAVGGPSGAVVPGANGRILFARGIYPCTSGCSWEIVAADPNDTNETVLAGPYPRNAFNDFLIANWSPDASKAIFMVNNGIWEVNTDGSGLHELIQAPSGTGFGDGPSFTPDGKQIVMEHCCIKGYGDSLWIMNSDGTGLKPLTSEASGVWGDTTPQVSPDGGRIVFNRCSDSGCVIATVNINGGGRRLLTDLTVFESEHPNWSPDSKQIVFYKRFPDDIYIMNADGSGLTQLTFNGPSGKNGSFQPCFSPDGTKILFSHFLSTGWADLFTMNPDGSGVTQVTTTGTPEFSAEWAVAS